MIVRSAPQTVCGVQWGAATIVPYVSAFGWWVSISIPNPRFVAFWTVRAARVMASDFSVMVLRKLRRRLNRFISKTGAMTFP